MISGGIITFASFSESSYIANTEVALDNPTVGLYLDVKGSPGFEKCRFERELILAGDL
jgi:hypothetical protein